MPLYLPRIIFTIVNLLLLSLVMIIVFKSLRNLKDYLSRHKAMDKKLDKILSQLDTIEKQFEEEHNE